ncbi:MAG: ribonuclease PH [Actinobacteria bacterium HGW-Actinobacteria-10]|jgi:ribonuclease PH|nr:MAG: ribonuclease PH [Actinobacteria bacterium HGW-Actinobacteria-10]
MHRFNGRDASAIRPVKVTRRYLRHAHGSCLFELGDTRVLCAASFSDGVGSWRKGKGLGWVTAEYALLPASTHSRSRRESTSGGPRGRTHEIQRLIGRSLRSVIDMRGMGGEYTLNIDCDVIQADGGTRTAAITGAYLAVYDAFSTWRDAGRITDIPLLDAIAATSVGMVDGELLLDLDYAEDSNAEVDMNVVMDNQGRFIEVQGTGERTPFDRARLDSMLDLAVSGIDQLLASQRAVIEGEGDVFEF